MSSEKPLFRSIDCVRLHVDDLEAGLRFYRDQLGHELIWRMGNVAGLRLPDNQAEIVLITDPIPPEIDFLVSSADEAARRFVEAGGTIVLGPFDIPIGRCVVVRDPWGNQYIMLDTNKGLLVTDEAGNVIGNQI